MASIQVGVADNRAFVQDVRFKPAGVGILGAEYGAAQSFPFPGFGRGLGAGDADAEFARFIARGRSADVGHPVIAFEGFRSVAAAPFGIL